MSDTISYRPATEADIPQMVVLMNANYARKVADSYFSWQFIDSHYPTIFMGAFQEEKLIGMFGLQKRSLTNGFAIGHLIDLLVSEGMRGKGIFSELGKRAIAHFPDLAALSVLPNPHGKAACEKALGMKTIAKVDSLLLKKPTASLSSPKSLPLNTMGTFVEFIRDDAYGAWRYDAHPKYRYTRIPKNLESFAVTKSFTDPTTQETFGDIVDYRADARNTEHLASLFTIASNTLLSDQGFQSITTWALPHTPLYKILKSLGYSELPQERYFCVKALQPDAEFLYDITQWNVVQADAEIY